MNNTDKHPRLKWRRGCLFRSGTANPLSIGIWDSRLFFARCVFPGGSRVFLFYLPRLVLGVIRSRRKQLFRLLIHRNAPNVLIISQGFKLPSGRYNRWVWDGRTPSYVLLLFVRRIVLFAYLQEGASCKSEPLSITEGAVIHDY